jgi:DNA topoisomerase-1
VPHSDVPSPIEPESAAREAGLTYVSPEDPGIRRLEAPGGFRYRKDRGGSVRDPETLARIRALAIPPAWTDVWICPSANGHLQAVGRDARGRRQYRYHRRWREVRDSAKYEHVLAFARALPRIRRRVARDLARRSIDREKVLSTVVRLLESTLIRVGNEEYVKANRSFGLSTMRDRHVSVRGSSIEFRFRGKSGKPHSIDLVDRRLARVLRRLQDLPGQRLFQYMSEGQLRDVESGDVNAYLRAISGSDFTAKDFRTWAGTVLAAASLQEMEKFDSEAQARRNILAAIERTAARLGNTPAICRKCYIHPRIFEAYLDGSLASVAAFRASESARGIARLHPEEAAVLALLQRRLQKTAGAKHRRSREKRALPRGLQRNERKGKGFTILGRCNAGKALPLVHRAMEKANQVDD